MKPRPGRRTRNARDPSDGHKHERTPRPTREELAFVEEVGILFEDIGIPRMAGRVFGRLLIADPPVQSSAQLMRFLGASKGSISTMTRLLIQQGLIERVGVPGERIDHFRIKLDAWQKLAVEQVRATRIRTLLERGAGVRAARSPDVGRRLEEARALHAFLERELPKLLERFDLERVSGK